MKKLLSLLAVAALLVCLSATAFAGQAAIVMDGQTIAPGTVPSTDSAVVVDGGGQILFDPNTGASAANYGGVVTVTKSPTGEKVDKGGKATFVAHAANATGVTWRLVSSDTLDTIYAAAAPEYFDGLVVYGANSDSLTLSNIPDSLNGWQAEAMFSGEGGPVFTYGARITVNGSSANGTTTDKNPTGRVVAGITGSGSVPLISGQPSGAELTSGKSTTLSVTAGTNDGGTLRYQWYISASDDNTAGQAIAGATSASYTPGEIQGTRYYYVGVWSEKDGAKSDTVYSSTAAVTYSGAAIATPSPAPTANTSNTGTTTNTNSNTNSNTTTNTNSGTTSGSNTTTNTGNGTTTSPSQPIATEDPNASTEPEGTVEEPSPTLAEVTRQGDSGSSLPVVLGAIAAVAMAAGVGLLVLRRNAGQ